MSHLFSLHGPEINLDLLQTPKFQLVLPHGTSGTWASVGESEGETSPETCGKPLRCLHEVLGRIHVPSMLSESSCCCCYSCSITKSCPALCEPMDCSAPGSMGSSRQEYWSELPFPSSGDFPGPVSCISNRFFPTEPPGKLCAAVIPALSQPPCAAHLSVLDGAKGKWASLEASCTVEEARSSITCSHLARWVRWWAETLKITLHKLF